MTDALPQGKYTFPGKQGFLNLIAAAIAFPPGFKTPLGALSPTRHRSPAIGPIRYTVLSAKNSREPFGKTGIS
jgi:hypothetical protein